MQPGTFKRIRSLCNRSLGRGYGQTELQRTSKTVQIRR
jgi:hypothetical protein